MFEHQGKRLLSRAWMVEPGQVIKPTGPSSHPWNEEYYFSYGGRHRSWEDAMRYGFVSAGGGAWYTGTMQNLEIGNRIWVNIPHAGYVEVGTVVEPAKPARETVLSVNAREANFFDLPLKANYFRESPPEKEEYIVRVSWQHIVPQKDAIKEYGFFGNQNTVCRPKAEKWDFTVKRLKEIWGIDN